MLLSIKSCYSSSQTRVSEALQMKLVPAFHFVLCGGKGETYALLRASPSQTSAPLSTTKPTIQTTTKLEPNAHISGTIVCMYNLYNAHQVTKAKAKTQRPMRKYPSLDARSPVWLLLLRLDLALAQGRGSTCCSSSCWSKGRYIWARRHDLSNPWPR